MSSKVGDLVNELAIADLNLLTNDYWIYFESLDKLTDYKIKKSTLFGNQVFGSETGITAHAGGGQGSAYALTKKCSYVTVVASANDSLVMPAAKVGMEMFVGNAGANTLYLYPAVGEQILGRAVNANTTVATTKGIMMVCIVDGIWMERSF